MRTLERDGCSIAYRMRGDGVPVVMIQGVGVHGDGWDPQVADLAAGHACLTFDNRGMGKSQPLSGELSVERMAEDALALMDAVEWESAHLVGHSLGGPVAMAVALAARERVRSLSLLCTFASGKDAAPPTFRMIWLGTRTRLGTRRQRRRAFLRLVMPPSVFASIDADALAAQLAPAFGHDLADQPPVVGAQLGAMRAFDARARLSELAGIPTLVVACEHDPIAPPAAGRRLANGILGARFVELADASHGLTLASPDVVNPLVRDHVASVEAARASS